MFNFDPLYPLVLFSSTPDGNNCLVQAFTGHYPFSHQLYHLDQFSEFGLNECLINPIFQHILQFWRFECIWCVIRSKATTDFGARVTPQQDVCLPGASLTNVPNIRGRSGGFGRGQWDNPYVGKTDELTSLHRITEVITINPVNE
jgi:hypothetical protein